MPIAGLTRLRAHQFGRQSVFGTAVAAKRRYPYGGVPSVNLGWTDPEGDFGSIDKIAAPYRQAQEVTASLTDAALAYNNIPILMTGIFGGGVNAVGAGADKTWTHQPASLTVDAFDLFTYEFGDDVTTDWYQLYDGILETVTITIPDNLGPLTVAKTWRFSKALSKSSTESPVVGTVPTAGLTVDTAPVPVFAGDGKLFIDTVAANIGTTQIASAFHGGSIAITQEVDLKRFIDGVGFALSDYGRGPRTIHTELNFAKTSNTVGTGSETDAWFSDVPVERFVEIKFTSTQLAAVAVPYSWSLRQAMRYYTREEGALANNTMITLAGDAFYKPTTPGYAVRSVAVTTLATAGL